MREGIAKNNPIDVSLFRKLYPKHKLPDKSYVTYNNKLYYIKNNKFSFIKLFSNRKRPQEENIVSKSKKHSDLKQEWIKKWKLEIEAQKKITNNNL